MSSLCPSCREPLDYPSGDGCAAMTKHKEWSNDMSYWHYQLMYHKYEKPQLGEEGYYAIHEYYDLEEGPAWTENPVDVTGNSIDDIRKMLICILKDCDTYGVKDYDADKQ